MCAFMPASANWIGSIPAAARRSTSGCHASGTGAGAGSDSASAAAKYRFANVTSSRLMKPASAKNPWVSEALTCLVTSRYMRLKQASPSAAGSAAAIASIRAMASATDTTGASGTGKASDMAITLRREALQPTCTVAGNAPATGRPHPVAWHASVTAAPAVTPRATKPKRRIPL